MSSKGFGFVAFFASAEASYVSLIISHAKISISEIINIFERDYFVLGFFVVYIKLWTTLYKKETLQVEYLFFLICHRVSFSRIYMEVHYGPSHFKNSDGSLVDLSVIGEYTPSTLIHTAKLVGRPHIVVSSRIIRRREGDTHGHDESRFEESI